MGTIYNYFDRKEDILRYIFQVERDKRAAFFQRLRSRGTHPLGRIEAILQFHFAELEEEPDLVKVILREGRLAHAHHLGRPAQGGLREFLQETLEEGVAQGHLRPCNAEAVATIIFGAIEAIWPGRWRNWRAAPPRPSSGQPQPRSPPFSGAGWLPGERGGLHLPRASCARGPGWPTSSSSWGPGERRSFRR